MLVREQVCWCLVVERLVGTLVAVKFKIVRQTSQQGRATLKIAGINQFVFERASQSLDEHIVERAAATVHTNGNATLFERCQKLC